DTVAKLLGERSLKRVIRDIAASVHKGHLLRQSAGLPRGGELVGALTFLRPGNIYRVNVGGLPLMTAVTANISNPHREIGSKLLLQRQVPVVIPRYLEAVVRIKRDIGLRRNRRGRE